MKKSIINFIVIVFMLCLLVGCRNQDNLKVYKTTSMTSTENSIIISEKFTKEEYDGFSYKLPECCRTLEWKCDLDGTLIQIWDFTSVKFADKVIPEQIESQIKSYDESLQYALYYKYDINDDGLEDLIVLSGNETTRTWKPFTGIFINKSKVDYEFIKCSLNSKYIKILNTTTNGMHDILTGYYGDNIITFNGIDSYSEPYEETFGGMLGEFLYNDDIVKPSMTFVINKDFFPDEKCYLIFRTTPDIDKYTKEKIWYASNPDGTPIILDKDTEINSNNIDFYMQMNENISEIPSDFWFLEMKFVPIN